MAGLPVTRKNSKTAEDQNAEKTRLESRLEELLSNVEGVGEVEVIIMTGDEGNTENFSISSKNEVTGVLVAAQGAGSAVTVQNIQQAIMALFQIDANKIKITYLNTFFCKWRKQCLQGNDLHENCDL